MKADHEFTVQGSGHNHLINQAVELSPIKSTNPCMYSDIEPPVVLCQKRDCDPAKSKKFVKTTYQKH